MSISSQPVPFTIPNVDHGLRKAEGVLKLDDGMLNLEYKTKDGFVGVIQSDIQELRIPLKELEGVEFKKGLFSHKLILHGTSMKSFEKVPGTEQASCTLKIARKNRKSAQNLASQIRLFLSEEKLRKLDES